MKVRTKKLMFAKYRKVRNKWEKDYTTDKKAMKQHMKALMHKY